MSAREPREGHLQTERREAILETLRKAALAREEYLLRRQRKAILERSRRVAVVGAGTDPHSESYIRTQKLLGLGVEIVPILPGCASYLGLGCYATLSEVPGDLDMVQIYPREGTDLLTLAREAIARRVSTFWVEEAGLDPEIKNLLADGRVQVVEHESLEKEYVKHLPETPTISLDRQKRGVTVGERMTRHPVTVSPRDGLNEAIEKMKKGRFRHLPVVDDEGKLIGMLSDRDIRLVRPSLLFISRDEASAQEWSTAVLQAAIFNPVVIYPHARLEQAAELMLRWEIGGLPVVDETGRPVGMITYTDILHEFLARGKES